MEQARDRLNARGMTATVKLSGPANPAYLKPTPLPSLHIHLEIDPNGQC